MEQDPEVAAFISRPPDPARPYVYPGTNIRINKFGLLNPYAIDQVTRAFSNLRSELLQLTPIPGEFDLAHLQAIHRYLFQDVYPWAGDIRVVDFDRSEADFTHPDIIIAKCNELFEQLQGEGHLRGLDWDEFTVRLSHYILRLFAIHPFRDGNGRAIRALIQQLCRECGYSFDLASRPQGERHATAKAAHFGDVAPFLASIRQVTRPLATPNGG
jgi:cell filamentation protein